MSYAVKLHVGDTGALVIEQENGRLSSHEKLLERQNLTPIAATGSATSAAFPQRESNTTRAWVLSSRTSSISVLVVSLSSSSDGWNMVSCCSGERLSSLGAISWMLILLKSHPWLRPTAYAILRDFQKA